MYTKIIKALKQGSTGLNIPKSFCEILNINPGDLLEVILDKDKNQFIVRKFNDDH